MAIDISTLATSSNQLSAVADLILVTPNQNLGYQPEALNAKDGQPLDTPAAILFHYEGEQSVTLESEITDHYIEDNSSIQDHIAIKPETITTQGFVGELNDIAPLPLVPLKFAAEKLTTIQGYSPQLSETALRQYNQAAFAYANTKKLINTAVSTVRTLGNILGLGDSQVQTKQQQYFTEFYGYWSERRLFTVQTPWGIFQHMAIKSLRSIQDKETRMITDFDVTFKAVRFAESVSEVSGTSNALKRSGRAVAQASNKIFLGNSVPKESFGLLARLGLNTNVVGGAF